MPVDVLDAARAVATAFNAGTQRQQKERNEALYKLDPKLLDAISSLATAVRRAR